MTDIIFLALTLGGLCLGLLLASVLCYIFSPKMREEIKQDWRGR